MAKNSSSINTDFIISFFLPEGMIDWFEVVNIKEEPNKGTAQADVLYNSILHIYLDERDTGMYYIWLGLGFHGSFKLRRKKRLYRNYLY